MSQSVPTPAAVSGTSDRRSPAVRSTGIVDEFSERLTARDFAGLGECLASDATARLLLPRGHDDLIGKLEIVSRLQEWFGAASQFEILSSAHHHIGSRHRATWRFRLVRDRQHWEVIE